MHKKILAAICSVLVVFSYTSVPANATQSLSAKYSSMYVRTGDKATDIVNIALAQTGKKKADFGYTEAWCADFVGDCAILAGASDAIPMNGKVSSLYKAVLNAGGTEVAIPQKGDLVFYYCTVHGYVHAGIMVDSQKSIEGNYSGKVSLVNGVYRDTYGDSLASGVVIRKFVRPAYNGAIIPAPTPTPDPAPTPTPTPAPKPSNNTRDNSDTKKDDNKSDSKKDDTKSDTKKDDSKSDSKKNTELKFTTKGAGDYEVTTQSSPLTLRKEADTSSAYLGSIPKGTIIRVTKTSGTSDDSWAYTTYNGVKGYVSMQYLTKAKAPKKGDKFTYDSAEYKVLSVSKKSVKVQFVKPADTDSEKVEIPEKFIRGSYTYTVTAIGAKAFADAKKLKQINIQSTKITSVKKNAFRGVDTTVEIEVPKAKYSKYSKLFKTAGISSEIKLKKI